MAFIKEEEAIFNGLKEVAQQMVLAARTAPEARGVSTLFTAIAGREEIDRIADRMVQIGEVNGQSFFLRDAENIRSSPLLVLLGTRIHPLNLFYCGYCGFENCSEKIKHPEVPCVFNTGDLGIAVGSAISVAMDHRVDNRIMYTAGIAAVEMKMLGEAVKIAYGIPLSATSKNPFFDRKH